MYIPFDYLLKTAYYKLAADRAKEFMLRFPFFGRSRYVCKVQTGNI